MKLIRGKDRPEVMVKWYYYTKWYDYTKWLLDRVGCFPKNQGFALGKAFGFSPDKPLLAARIAEGECCPRPCRAQEPPGVPVGGLVSVFRRISQRSAAVSIPLGKIPCGATGQIDAWRCAR